MEVADNLPGMVLVRDSKDRTGPMLTFAPTVWAAFVSQVKGRPHLGRPKPGAATRCAGSR
ncbi:uncharacterized protein DUF397 [Micromonospora kangleipakensis]|uniref:Uncharacterized protein DUF397 n=1 Tax=Micromonospora kangleipakensis TaxID=1077942 RepID=A0A4Q8B6Q4_9ACTN|nr:uncharacterized protein DUF397 [Micromonospora kangleipakensis]